MSKIIIPGPNPGEFKEAPSIAPAPPAPEEQSTELKATQLPMPSGWRILCAIPDAEEKYESGIIKADITKKHEEVMTTVLFVIALGPDAYQDKTRYPTGPWCKEGDFVIVPSTSGIRLDIHGKEFRLINEDTVQATVQDPRGIKRK